MSQTIEDLFDFPGYWPSKKLGKIADVISPGFPCGDHNQQGEGVPHLRPMNISEDGEIDLSKVKYVEEEYTPLRAGDVLFNNTNSPKLVGKTAHIDLDKEWAHSNHMTRIRDFVDEVYSKWVAHWLQFLFRDGYFRMHCRNHVNQASIGVNFLESKVDVPLPPLPEQCRIVAKIEELFSNLDAGMGDLQTAEQQLERYRLSVLQAAVEGRLTADWRRTHDPEPAEQLLERILEKRREQWEEDYRAKYEAKGKEPPSGWKSRYTEPEPLESTDGLPNLPPGWRWASGDQMLYYVTSGSRGWSKYYDDEGQLFIRVGDISDPDVEINFSDVQRVNLPDEERGHRSLLEPRDLLISITADIGKVGIVPQEIEEAYINQHVALTRPADPETTRYLAYYLISPGGGAKQFRKLQKGATKAGLTLTNIKELAIALPPAPELKQIVDEVERLLSVADDAAATADREHTRAERLRQSILKQAFSGRLVPHDKDADPPAIESSSSNGTGQDSSGDTSSSANDDYSGEDDVVAEELHNGGDPGKQIEMDL